MYKITVIRDNVRETIVHSIKFVLYWCVMFIWALLAGMNCIISRPEKRLDNFIRQSKQNIRKYIAFVTQLYDNNGGNSNNGGISGENLSEIGFFGGSAKNDSLNVPDGMSIDEFIKKHANRESEESAKMRIFAKRVIIRRLVSFLKAHNESNDHIRDYHSSLRQRGYTTDEIGTYGHRKTITATTTTVHETTFPHMFAPCNQNHNVYLSMSTMDDTDDGFSVSLSRSTWDCRKKHDGSRLDELSICRELLCIVRDDLETELHYYVKSVKICGVDVCQKIAQPTHTSTTTTTTTTPGTGYHHDYSFSDLKLIISFCNLPNGMLLEEISRHAIRGIVYFLFTCLLLLIWSAIGRILAKYSSSFY
jgi:hypothetical protein